jgi:hypothetical protein
MKIKGQNKITSAVKSGASLPSPNVFCICIVIVVFIIDKIEEMTELARLTFLKMPLTRKNDPDLRE